MFRLESAEGREIVARSKLKPVAADEALEKLLEKETNGHVPGRLAGNEPLWQTCLTLPLGSRRFKRNGRHFRWDLLGSVPHLTTFTGRNTMYFVTRIKIYTHVFLRGAELGEAGTYDEDEIAVMVDLFVTFMQLREAGSRIGLLGTVDTNAVCWVSRGGGVYLV